MNIESGNADCICPPGDEYGPLCRTDCPIHGLIQPKKPVGAALTDSYILALYDQVLSEHADGRGHDAGVIAFARDLLAQHKVNTKLAIEALRAAQNNIGAWRPLGSSDPKSPHYDHDAFMWDHYQKAIDSMLSPSQDEREPSSTIDK